MEEDLTALTIHNPTNEDFTVKWNGKFYTVPARGQNTFVSSLSKHIANKLAQKMVILNHGEAFMANKTYLDKYLKQIIAEIRTDIPVIKVPKTREEIIEQQNALIQTKFTAEDEKNAEVISEGFEDLNPQPADEAELTRELEAENDPQAARKYALEDMTFSEVKTIAKALEINMLHKSRVDIEKEIVEKEFKK